MRLLLLKLCLLLNGQLIENGLTRTGIEEADVHRLDLLLLLLVLGALLENVSNAGKFLLAHLLGLLLLLLVLQWDVEGRST